MPDRDLIIQLKEEFDVRTSNALAERLDIPLATLAKAERGEGRLPWKARVIILDKMGFAAARRAVESLVPDRLAQRIRDASNRQFLAGVNDEELELQINDDSDPKAGSCQALLALLQDINRSDFNDELSPFLKLVSTKYNNREPGNLDAVDRAKLVETLYKLDAKRWESLVAKLSECVSSDALMYAAILSVVNQEREGGLGKQVIEFIGEVKGAKNDKELCAVLDITPSKLSRIRSGKTKIAPEVAVFAEFLGSSSDISANEREFRELDRLARNPDLILEELRNKNSKRA